MDYKSDLYQLARIALENDKSDIVAMVKKIYRKSKKEDDTLANKLSKLIAENQNDIFRGTSIPHMPVDQDNRLELLQKYLPKELPFEPIWNDHVKEELQQLLEERTKSEILVKASLPVSKAVLFYGIPGVGKTLAAKWLSGQLGLPLLVLDLSAVISSFLGRTGNNIKSIFQYAKSFPCILLLDELDAIAKRRDDLGELGELKRLVTVLIQEMDNWPEGNLLIAATNHPDLLDPAIWRRFDYSLEFKTPEDLKKVEHLLKLYLDNDYDKVKSSIDYLKYCFWGCSFDEIERIIKKARRKSLLMDQNLEEIFAIELKSLFKKIDKDTKSLIVKKMIGELSQRRISDITGMSRTTISKIIGE